MMKLISIIILCGPTLALCGTCQYSEYTFSCDNITQDELLYELYKHRSLVSSIEEVIITNSNFSTIEDFPNFRNLFNSDIYKLTIRNSSIQHISNEAFQVLSSLEKLDLSENNVKDLEFLKTLSRSVRTIILSQNNLERIDLTQFYGINNYIQRLDLSKNKISSIIPHITTFLLNSIDLSYNKLTNFNETNLKSNFGSLNLSFNLLENIEITDRKTVLAVVGNNISCINSNKDVSISEFYSSFIPKNLIIDNSIFSVTNTYLGSLNNGNKLNIRSLYYNYDIDFSRTNLSDISENYFQNMDIRILNLSYNNLNILNEPLFSNSYINRLDLSNSGIRNITKKVFRNIRLNNNDFSLNLSRNLLEEAAALCETLTTLTNLDLSVNNITKLQSNSFQNCTYLNFLNLNENKIIHIGPDDFKNITRLETLLLSKNNISTIDSKAFENLRSLKILDLSNNIIDNIGEYAFSNLNSLITINLSFNRLKRLESDTFVNLYIQNLYLQGNDIRYMKSKAFEGLYNLRILNLSNIGLSVLEENVFYNMSSIEIIDLSNNYLTILENNTFTNLPLKELYLNNNKIAEIRTGAFRNLKLRNLNISNLGINKLEPFAFSYLQNLDSIDLRNNNLTGIQPNVFKNINVQTMYLNGVSQRVNLDNTVVIRNLILQLNGTLEERMISNANLKNLRLVDYQIDVMKNNCLLGNYGLTQLLIDNSNISSIESNALAGLFSLVNLDASVLFKNEQNLEANIFKELNSLKILKISDTKINKIDNETFSGLTSLKELYLDGNNLSSINSNIFAPLNSSLTILDLSRNSFRTLNLSDISYLSKLITLNISSASIYYLVNSNDLFSNSIQYLYLTDNYISSLGASIFRQFENLKQLFINSNSLSSFSFQTFNYTKNLEVLRLDNNTINSLSYGILDGLENLKSFNISSNYNSYGYSLQITNLVSLKNIRSLYLDNTNMGNNFEYNNINRYFPYLKRITINNNSFSCSFLSNLLIYFNTYNYDYYPYNPRFDVQNINGIICT